MTSLVNEREAVLAVAVEVTGDPLRVDLTDGRTISVPTTWYPRLKHGDATERGNWRLIGRGEGIHWPDLDEDILIADLLLGIPSGESQPSLKREIHPMVEKISGLVPAEVDAEAEYHEYLLKKH